MVIHYKRIYGECERIEPVQVRGVRRDGDGLQREEAGHHGGGPLREGRVHGEAAHAHQHRHHHAHEGPRAQDAGGQDGHQGQQDAREHHPADRRPGRIAVPQAS